MNAADFDRGYANFESILLNRYLSETDGPDVDDWDEEESYWEALLEEVDHALGLR